MSPRGRKARAEQLGLSTARVLPPPAPTPPLSPIEAAGVAHRATLRQLWALLDAVGELRAADTDHEATIRHRLRLLYDRATIAHEYYGRAMASLATGATHG